MLNQSRPYRYLVLTTAKSISRVFRLTSGEGKIVVVNISVILISFSITEDKRSYFRSNTCLQKLHIDNIPLYKYNYDTFVDYVDLLISKMAVTTARSLKIAMLC